MSRTIVKVRNGGTPPVIERRITSAFDRRFWRRPGLVGGSMMVSILPAIIMGLVMTLILKDTQEGFVAGIGQTLLWAILATAIAVPLFPLIAFMAASSSDIERMQTATDRLAAFARHHGVLPDGIERDYYEMFPAARLAVDDDRRELLLRVEAVLDRLDETLGETSTDAEAVSGARLVAARAINQIIVRHEARLASRMAETGAMQRLEADVALLASDGETDALPAPTAPTARIARIVQTAERALARRPDLVDDQGARVDDLVRRHVPRLLQRHAHAAATAPIEEVAAVDARLEQGVERIRRSVESALEILHDEAMDDLVQELRFLELRAGGDTDLTTIV